MVCMIHSKMEEVVLAFEAKILDENSHGGHSIQVTTPRIDFRVLLKPCLLPVNRFAIISVVLPMAAGFTIVLRSQTAFHVSWPLHKFCEFRGY